MRPWPAKVFQQASIATTSFLQRVPKDGQLVEGLPLGDAPGQLDDAGVVPDKDSWRE
jgi:hypothetical protein